MSRTRGSASKDLGRRAFGTAGGWEASREAQEILRTPVASPVPRAWKPRAGRIYNFPVRRIVEEK
jgi:hypothetical protein